MDAAEYLDSEGHIYATTLSTQTDINNWLCESNWAKTARIDSEIAPFEEIGIAVGNSIDGD